VGGELLATGVVRFVGRREGWRLEEADGEGAEAVRRGKWSERKEMQGLCRTSCRCG
jgi:hypothetical protein